jgi:hypothetical protein
LDHARTRSLLSGSGNSSPGATSNPNARSRVRPCIHSWRTLGAGGVRPTETSWLAHWPWPECLARTSRLAWTALLVCAVMGGATLLRHHPRRGRARRPHHRCRGRHRSTASSLQSLLVLVRWVGKPRLLGLLLLMANDRAKMRHRRATNRAATGFVPHHAAPRRRGCPATRGLRAPLLGLCVRHNGARAPARITYGSPASAGMPFSPLWRALLALCFWAALWASSWAAWATTVGTTKDRRRTP